MVLQYGFGVSVRARDVISQQRFDATGDLFYKTVTIVCRRLCFLGCLKRLFRFDLPGVGFWNDALWRMSPQVIWKTALPRDGSSINLACDEKCSIPLAPRGMGRHNGGLRKGAGKRPKHFRRGVDWMARMTQKDVKRLRGIVWISVDTTKRRRSHPLGRGGAAGKEAILSANRCHGSSALSDNNSLGEEDSESNITWGVSTNDRLKSCAIAPFCGQGGWGRLFPRLAYKRIWYAPHYIRIGLYDFPTEPYFYELLRLICTGHQHFPHLFDPARSVHSIREVICRRPDCPGISCPFPGDGASGRITFGECRATLLSRIDPHGDNLLQWVLNDSGHRVSRYASSANARTGRFQWKPGRNAYCSGVTPLSFATGGISSDFDRRISVMMGKEKFDLLTSNVSLVTLDKYMVCWRRWAQSCAPPRRFPVESRRHAWTGWRADQFLVRGANFSGRIISRVREFCFRHTAHPYNGRVRRFPFSRPSHSRPS